MTNFLVLVYYTAKFERGIRAGVQNEKGVGKINNFQPISRHILEPVILNADLIFTAR